MSEEEAAFWQDARYRQGCADFDRADFYAAHDAWEDLWRESVGPERDFLQGLILFAVALHHFGNANLRGAHSRYRIACELLSSYPDRYGGIDLGALRQGMSRVLGDVESEPSDASLQGPFLPRLIRL